MSTLIEQFFLSFGLISLVAVVGGFLSARWKQPTVMGLLLVGMIVGPNALGIIQNNELISLLAELGATLLLFSIGLEFSLGVMLRSGLKAIFCATAIMAVLFIAGYEAAIFLGLGFSGSLALGAVFSFSSTAIFVSLMKSYNLVKSNFVPLLISILVIEDMVAVAAMAFFGSLRAEGAALTTASAVIFSILYSLVLMAFAYFIILEILKRIVKRYKKMLKKDSILQFALALSVLMAFLAMAIGLSPSVGAFLAGSIIAGLSIREEVELTMSNFTLVFSSYFFISIGLLVNPVVLLSELPVILMLCALFWVVASIAVGLAVFLSGQGAKNSFIAGISMAVMGEFSLLLAKEASPLIPEFDLITILSSVVFITAIVASLILSKREAVFTLLSKLQPKGFCSRVLSAQRYFTSVARDFEADGRVARKARAQFPHLAKNLAFFAISGLVILLIRAFLKYANFSVPILDIYVHPDAALLLFALLIPSILRIISDLKEITDSLSQAFISQKFVRRQDTTRKIAENAAIFAILVIMFILSPPAVHLLMLPSSFGLISLIPLFGMFIITYNTILLITRFFSREGL